jgi:hypothetical protein
MTRERQYRCLRVHVNDNLQRVSAVIGETGGTPPSLAPYPAPNHDGITPMAQAIIIGKSGTNLPHRRER